MENNPEVTATPEIYTIHLDIDYGKMVYQGTVTIEFESTFKGELELDALGIDIFKVSANSLEVPFEHDVLPGHLKVYLPNGGSSINVEFSGVIDESARGLYWVEDSGGKLIASQFGPSFTRTVFPCLDHPFFKARFSISVRISKEVNVISNMPVKDETVEGNLKQTIFETTPRMSPYLLYIGAGKFVENGAEKNERMVTITSDPEESPPFPGSVPFAEENIDFFEKYTGIKYPLPKLSLISVPSKGGAMENWGAIAFDKNILRGPVSNAIEFEKKCMKTISHEVAHQWFGDLVTMAWWDDMWLNESFATIMSYKSMSHLRKDWNVEREYLTSDFRGAMWVDSLSNTVKVSADTTSGDSIAYLPIEIRYGKGASLLRMIESYVGDENFREGIRSYLNKYKFRNATREDLWRELSSSSSMNVGNILREWIDAEGYPVVEVTTDGDIFRLKQKRFTFGKPEAQGRIWPIPLFMKNGTYTEPLLFHNKEMQVEKKDITGMNCDQKGFYRVFYDNESFSHITNNKDQLNEIETWGLVNDQFAFLLSGDLDLESYFDRISQFVDSSRMMVHDEISKQLYYLYVISGNEHIKEIMQILYGVNFFSKVAVQSGLPTEELQWLDNILYRTAAIDVGFSELLLSKSNKGNLQKHFTNALLCARVHALQTTEDLRSCYDQYFVKDEGGPDTRPLGWVSNRSQFSFIESLISGGKISGRDAVTVLTVLSENTLTKPYVMDKLENIVNLLNSKKFRIGSGWRFLESISHVAGADGLDLIRKYLKIASNPEFVRLINRCIESSELAVRTCNQVESHPEALLKFIGRITENNTHS